MTTLILLTALCYAPGETARPLGDPRVPTDGVRAAELPPIGPPTWPTPPSADPLRPAAEWLSTHVFELGMAWAFCFGLLGGYIAWRRDASVPEGLTLGALFGPLGVLVALWIPLPVPLAWRVERTGKGVAR